MQETLNYASAGNALSSFRRTHYLLPSPHLRFPTVSSRFTTAAATAATTLRHKPHKMPQIPSTAPPPPSPPPPSPPSPPYPNHHHVEFEEKALFLDSIGLDSVALLIHHPDTLSASSTLDDLKSLKDFLSSFGFTVADLRRIIRMYPQILTLHLNDVVPVFTFLLREVKVNGSDLRRVINRRPLLLACSVESRLRPTLYFLQSIGIHEVSKHTDLLTSSVEDRFMPKIEYFEKLGFSYRESISMFRTFPCLFRYSVERNIEPKFNYFVVEMGRELRELKEFPQYFSFSLERRIKPRHQRCVEMGVCFPLPALLKAKEEEFRERLDVCYGSSMPLRSSPLWGASYSDVNTKEIVL